MAAPSPSPPAVTSLHRLSDRLPLEIVAQITSHKAYARAVSEHRHPFPFLTLRTATTYQAGTIVELAARVQGTAARGYSTRVALGIDDDDTEISGRRDARNTTPLRLVGWGCSCPAAEHSEKACKHVAALLICTRQNPDGFRAVEADGRGNYSGMPTHERRTKGGHEPVPHEHPPREPHRGSGGAHNAGMPPRNRWSSPDAVVQKPQAATMTAAAMPFTIPPLPSSRPTSPPVPPGAAELLAAVREGERRAAERLEGQHTPVKPSGPVTTPATAPRRAPAPASPPPFSTAHGTTNRAALSDPVPPARAKRRLPEDYTTCGAPKKKSKPRPAQGSPAQPKRTALAKPPAEPAEPAPPPRKLPPRPPPGPLYRLTETELVDAAKRVLAPLAEQRLRELDAEREREGSRSGDEDRQRKDGQLKERSGDRFEAVERLGAKAGVRKLKGGAAEKRSGWKWKVALNSMDGKDVMMGVEDEDVRGRERSPADTNGAHGRTRSGAESEEEDTEDEAEPRMGTQIKPRAAAPTPPVPSKSAFPPRSAAAPFRPGVNASLGTCTGPPPDSESDSTSDEDVLIASSATTAKAPVSIRGGSLSGASSAPTESLSASVPSWAPRQALPGAAKNTGVAPGGSLLSSLGWTAAGSVPGEVKKRSRLDDFLDSI